MPGTAPAGYAHIFNGSGQGLDPGKLCALRDEKLRQAMLRMLPRAQA
jgi:hypothetical protein